MNDFEDTADQLSAATKLLQQQQTVYARDQSNGAQFQLQLKKTENLLKQLQQQFNQLKGAERQKATPQLKQYQEIIAQAQQKAFKTQNAISLPNQYQGAADNMSQVVNYTEDAKRAGGETLEMSKQIKNSLVNQNEQMKRIGNTAVGIGAHTQKANELVKEMYRKEKCVNWIIVAVDIVLVASWVLAFCVFHHII